MGQKALLYVGFGALAAYIYFKYKDGTPLSGNGHKIVDSAIPWLNIKNPHLESLVKQGAKGFMKGFMGSEHQETIDVEYERA